MNNIDSKIADAFVTVKSPYYKTEPYNNTAVKEFCKQTGYEPCAELTQIIKKYRASGGRNLQSFIRQVKDLYTIKTVDSNLDNPLDLTYDYDIKIERVSIKKNLPPNSLHFLNDYFLLKHLIVGVNGKLLQVGTDVVASQHSSYTQGQTVVFANSFIVREKLCAGDELVFRGAVNK